jgi:hypothetical protein
MTKKGFLTGYLGAIPPMRGIPKQEIPSIPRAGDNSEYNNRPFVCDWCGYRVNMPCKNKAHRRNCENV